MRQVTARRRAGASRRPARSRGASRRRTSRGSARHSAAAARGRRRRTAPARPRPARRPRARRRRGPRRTGGSRGARAGRREVPTARHGSLGGWFARHATHCRHARTRARRAFDATTDAAWGVPPEGGVRQTVHDAREQDTGAPAPTCHRVGNDPGASAADACPQGRADPRGRHARARDARARSRPAGRAHLAVRARRRLGGPGQRGGRPCRAHPPRPGAARLARLPAPRRARR